MKFMSPQHVAVMNDLLADADNVVAAASALDADLLVAYELSGGPDGRLVHWTVLVGPGGVRFGLEPPGRPADVVLRGDWSEMIRATKARRDGEVVPAPVRVVSGSAHLGLVLPVIAAAQDVATVPVDFPAV